MTRGSESFRAPGLRVRLSHWHGTTVRSRVRSGQPRPGTVTARRAVGKRAWRPRTEPLLANQGQPESRAPRHAHGGPAGSARAVRSPGIIRFASEVRLRNKSEGSNQMKGGGFASLAPGLLHV
eukprot:388141-Hanusia_phi.AAC.1